MYWRLLGAAETGRAGKVMALLAVALSVRICLLGCVMRRLCWVFWERGSRVSLQMDLRKPAFSLHACLHVRAC